MYMLQRFSKLKREGGTYFSKRAAKMLNLFSSYLFGGSAPKYDWNNATQSRSRGGAGYESTTAGGFAANGTADVSRGGVGRSGGVGDYGASRWSLMGNPPRPPRY